MSCKGLPLAPNTKSMSLMLRSNASLTCFSVRSIKLTIPTPKANKARLNAVCRGLACKFRQACVVTPSFMAVGG